MSEEIAVRFRYTLAELTKALRWHQRQGRRALGVRVFCWVVVVVCSAFTLLAYQRDGRFSPAMWGAAGAAYGLVLLSLTPRLGSWRARRNFAKGTSLDAEVEWQITEEILRLRSAHASAELRWTAFNKVVFTPDGLLLYPQPLIFHWLPRQGFESEAAFAAVSTIARGNIPARQELK